MYLSFCVVYSVMRVKLSDALNMKLRKTTVWVLCKMNRKIVNDAGERFDR